ncbi:MAG: hypothetical protein ACK493_15060 [Planctomycetota bacterium]
MDSETLKPKERRSFVEPSPYWLRIFGQVKRVRRYVDRKVQGGLLVRMAIHWGLFFFTSAFAYVVIQAIASPSGNSFLQRMQSALTVFSLLGLLMLTLVPAFMLDIIRFSNRFAGPMVRLRRFMKELGEVGDAPPLKFRDDDFWSELAKDFNLCRDRIIRQKLEIERLQLLISEYRTNGQITWKVEEQAVNQSD